MPVDKTYEKEFRDSLAALPGGKAFRAVREKGLEGFLSLGGIPHARAEDWRYAPIGALRQAHIPRAAKGKTKTPAVKGVTGWPMAVLHNGALVETPGIDGMEVLSSAEALPAWAAGFGAAGVEANPLERLNLALTDGGALVRVKKGVKAEGLEIVLINDGLKDSARHVRNLIVLEEGASLPVFIRTIAAGSSGWLNTVTHARLAKGAALDLAADFEAAPGVLVSAVFAGDLKSKASLHYGTVAAGLSSLRHEAEVTLDGAEACAHLAGGMLAAENEALDFLTRLHHMKGGATSAQAFKGVAAAKGKTAFQGRIVVEEQAQKTDARQNCHNLILDRSGEANVKPELLIFADDVACAHGATVGEIDEAALFYIMQRGIPEEEAKGILVRAFLGDIVETFGNETLQEFFEAKINAWMEKNSA